MELAEFLEEHYTQYGSAIQYLLQLAGRLAVQRTKPTVLQHILTGPSHDRMRGRAVLPDPEPHNVHQLRVRFHRYYWSTFTKEKNSWALLLFYFAESITMSVLLHLATCSWFPLSRRLVSQSSDPVPQWQLLLSRRCGKGVLPQKLSILYFFLPGRWRWAKVWPSWSDDQGPPSTCDGRGSHSTF